MVNRLMLCCESAKATFACSFPTPQVASTLERCCSSAPLTLSICLLLARSRAPRLVPLTGAQSRIEKAEHCLAGVVPSVLCRLPQSCAWSPSIPAFI